MAIKFLNSLDVTKDIATLGDKLYLTNVASSGQDGILAYDSTNTASGSRIFSFTRGGSNELKYHSYGFHRWYSGPASGTGDSTARMTLNSSGNLGIGTTSPTEKLDVRGNLNLTLSSASTTKLIPINNGGNSLLKFKGGNFIHYVTFETSWNNFEYATLKSSYSGSDTDFFLKKSDSSGNTVGNTKISTGTSYFNGNVGIGTTSPQSRLHITDANPILILEDTSNPNKNKIENVDGNMRYHADYGSDMGNSRHIFFIDNSEKLRIDTNGNVGIGTTNPENKLHLLTSTTDSTQQLLIQNGSTGDAAIKFNISGDTYSIGIDNSDSDKFKISAGNLGTNDRLVIDTSGRLGIGTNPVAGYSIATGGKITSSLAMVVSGVETGNPQPTANNAHLSGYGIIGNRGTFYVTNNGTVQIGNGATHNANPAASYTSSSITHYRPTTIASSGYIDLKIDQTDSAAIKMGVSSASTEGFIMTETTGGSHLSTDPVLKLLYNDGTVGEYARFTKNGLGIGTTSPSSKLHVYQGGNAELIVEGTNVARLSLKDPSVKTTIGTYNDGSLRLGAENNAATTQLVIKNNTVGIGKVPSGVKLDVNGNLRVTYSQTHVSGDISINKSALDLYNAWESDTDEKGSILTFSDNYSDGSGFQKTIRAAIKGGTDSTGNTANGFLAFYTDSSSANSATERMRIDKNGNVGIGTSSPSRGLHVNDHFIRIGDGTGTKLHIEGSGSSTKIQFRNSGGSWLSTETKGINIGDWNSDPSYGDVLVGTYDFDVLGDSLQSLLKVKNSGNVGIGTTNPDAKLDVSGGSLKVQSGDTFGYDGTHAAIYMDNSNGRGLSGKFGGNGYSRNLIKSDGSATISIGENTSLISRIILDAGSTATNGYISLQTKQVERVRITHDGKVGIGTTSPDEKLHVNGNIKGAILYATDDVVVADKILHYGDTDTYVQFDTNRIRLIAGGTTKFDTNDSILQQSTGDARYVNVTGDTMTGTLNTQALVPSTDSSYNLGNSTNRYLTVWSRYLNSGGNTLEIRGGGTTIFKQSDVERMRLNSTGLGIGTTSPQAKLNVKGSSGDTTNNADIQLSAESSGIFVDDANPSNSRFGIVKKWGSSAMVAAGSATPIRFGHWSTTNLKGNIQSGSFTEDLTIATNGNVGIGTTNPIQKLQVDGNIYSNGGNVYINGDKSFVAVGNMKFETWNGYAYGERMRITETGNVGIGTTSPAEKLDVEGNARAVNLIAESYAYAGTGFQHWGDGGTGMNFPSNDNVDILTAGTTRMRVDPSGIITINSNSEQGWSGNKLNVGSTSDGANGINILTSSTGNGYIIFSDASDNSSAEYANQIRYSHTDNFLAIQTVGTERLRIHSTGTVSIGTTAAYTTGGTSKLTVSGIVSIGASNNDLSYIRRSGAGHYQWQTFNGGNSGILNIQPYGGALVVGNDTSTSRGAVLTAVQHGNTETLNNTSVSDAAFAIMNSDPSYGLFGAVSTNGDALLQVRRISTNVKYNLNLQPHGGNVGIGTTSPAAKLTVAGTAYINQTSDYFGVSNTKVQISAGSSSNNVGIRSDKLYLYSYGNGTDSQLIFGDGNAHWALFASDNRFALYNHATSSTSMHVSSAGNVGIGTTSPDAPLHVAPDSNYKVIKLGDDTVSHYKFSGQADHTLTLTCNSYYMAEVVITASQSNGGAYNNLYIRGIWSNNHTSHHWDVLEEVGFMTGNNISITNSENDVENSGKLEIVHDYVSGGSFLGMTVRVTDYNGTHSYTIS